MHLFPLLSSNSAALQAHLVYSWIDSASFSIAHINIFEMRVRERRTGSFSHYQSYFHAHDTKTLDSSTLLLLVGVSNH